MNNQFDSRRFSLLFTKHTSEHLKAYLMAALALFGLMFSCVLFFSLTQNALLSGGFQRDVFWACLFVSGSIFTSNVFADLGNKTKAAASLMLPSSHFEKFLVNWIYSYLIFQLVYLGVFYGVMLIASSLVGFHGKAFEIYDLRSDARATTWIFLFYMLLNAIAILGSVYFQKLHLVKTMLATIGIFMLIMVLNGRVMELIVGNDVISNPIPFFRVFIPDGDYRYKLDLSRTQSQYLFIVPVIMAGILWTATYFRLKEKEI